jgi:hypothetical protein
MITIMLMLVLIIVGGWLDARLNWPATDNDESKGEWR